MVRNEDAGILKADILGSEGRNKVDFKERIIF